VHIARVLGDIQTIFRRQAESKGIELAIEVESQPRHRPDTSPENHPAADNEGWRGALPQRVRGDPVRVKQVVSNLVSNALKFTPDGGKIVIGARLGSSPLREVGVDGPGSVFAPRNLATRIALVSPFGGGLSVPSPSADHRGLGLGLGVAGEGRPELPSCPASMHQIEISVRDTGVGIRADDIAGLFTPYK